MAVKDVKHKQEMESKGDDIEELKSLNTSYENGVFDDQFNYQTDDALKRSLLIKVKKIENNLFGVLLLDRNIKRTGVL